MTALFLLTALRNYPFQLLGATDTPWPVLPSYKCIIPNSASIPVFSLTNLSASVL